MPLHSDDRALFERCLLAFERGTPPEPADARAFFDALAGYHDGGDDLVARALSLAASPPFSDSRRADDALERFIRDFDRPALVRAAAGALTRRWRALAAGAPLTGVTARRAVRMARSYDHAPAADRFTWAWLARPGGVTLAARIAPGAELGLDVLDPVLPELLSGDLDDDAIALFGALVLHSSWIARRVLLNQVGGPEHAPLLPSLARASTLVDPTTALALVGALGRIGHPAAEHPLATILLKPDPGPDLAILAALAELGTTTYLETLRAFARDAPDATTRAAALAAVDAISTRAARGGGLTLVDGGDLSGALSPSASAGSGALSAPGGAPAPGAPEAATSNDAGAPAPPRAPRAEDPFHALVRRRVDEGALDHVAPTALAQANWLSLAAAPRRVPGLFVITDAPVVPFAVAGAGFALLLSAVFHSVMISLLLVPVVVATSAPGLSSLRRAWRHRRLLRDGLPSLGEPSAYDHARAGRTISFLTGDNRRLAPFVPMPEHDSRLERGLQPLLYDPETGDAELFAFIEGVELAPSGELLSRRSAQVYGALSIALFVFGLVVQVLSLL
jgi:hypothetical protein